MGLNSSRQTDPLQNLFSDIAKILEYIEVKDNKAAALYETTEISEHARTWMNAILGNDTYLTYRQYWTIGMFQEILPNVKYNNIRYFMEHPYNVPLDFRDNLLQKGRELFLNQYQEKNNYYRMLSGLPDIEDTEYIYLSEPMRNQLHASELPVHELSDLIQNSWMATNDYQEVIAKYPEKKYLKYLGSYKVDIFAARNAKDFEIIRYVTNRSDINPNLVKEFASLYADYREYVVTTLYNAQFENVYVNYRNFMGLLIMMFVLMHISDKGLEAINTRAFLDDSVIHILLSMYGISNTMLMTKEVRRDLAIKLLQLTRMKGTDEIYNELVEILGYQEVIISKLMLMKGQQFDSNNNYKALEENDPYFLQLDITDKNPYETIANGNAIRHDYHSIVDGDPYWWDLEDVRKILHEYQYTISDSKYIMIEAIVYQMKYMFESIYFARMILDNKTATDTFMVEIPDLFGTEMISIYDLMVFVVAAMCMNNGLKGEIINNETKLLATAGFNFDLNYDTFMEYLDTCKYADVDRVKSFMSNLTMTNPSDVSRLFNDVMYPMREWLEQKISNATNRFEYVEYESIYRALYTYDINRNPFLSDFKKPLKIIQEKYHLTDEDIQAYQHFYPRTMSGEKIVVEDYNEKVNNTLYKYPFLNRSNIIDYHIHITIDYLGHEEDRGELYFHDILNFDDVRQIGENGFKVFCDYEDETIGWQVNQKAVEKAIEMIDVLDEDALYQAYFQIQTPIMNSGGKYYAEEEKLPASIRAGVYKDILKEKIIMDCEGLSEPPKTYLEYLYRKNNKLYELLTNNRRFDLDHEAWLEDVMKVVLTLETELDIHMKYFEQAVVGTDQFFKPLIELIKRFKSTYIQFAKTGLKYIIGDKIDAGGNSNMFRLFDEVDFIIHFVTLANKEYLSRFGLYDAIHKTKTHILIKDKSNILSEDKDGFHVNLRDMHSGSLRLIDEAKFYKNGRVLDEWISGEPGTGRWVNDHKVVNE